MRGFAPNAQGTHDTTGAPRSVSAVKGNPMTNLTTDHIVPVLGVDRSDAADRGAFQIVAWQYDGGPQTPRGQGDGP